jgi:TP901 family phage tail tape measure protein
MPGPNVFEAETRLKDFMSKQFRQMEQVVKGSSARMQGATQKTGASMGMMGNMAKKTGASIAGFAARFGPAALAVTGLTIVTMKLRDGLQLVRESTENFEASVSKIKAIVTPTEMELASLADKAKELGETTAFTATQSAEAFVLLGQAGLKANQIIAVSADVLNLAAAAGTEMTQASEAVVEILGQYRLDATEANRVTDVMAKSFNVSKLNMDRLQESMKFAGATAGQLGVSLEETTAMLAELSQKGISGSMAGTALRRIMLQLGDSSSAAGKMIGLTANDTRTFTERLAALQEKNLSPGQIKSTFGLLASTAAGVLIEGSEGVKTYTDLLRKADGTAKKMADTMLDNVKGATIILKSAQEGLAIAIGESFGKNKQERIEEYTDHIKELTAVVKAGEGEIAALGETWDWFARQLSGMGIQTLRLLLLMLNQVQQGALEVQISFLKAANVVPKLAQKIGIEVGDLTEKIQGLGQEKAEVIISRMRILSGEMGVLAAAADEAGEKVTGVIAPPVEGVAGGPSELSDVENEALEKEKALKEKQAQDAMEFELMQIAGAEAMRAAADEKELSRLTGKYKKEQKLFNDNLKITRAAKKDEEKLAKAAEASKQKAMMETIDVMSTVAKAMGASAEQQRGIAMIESIVHTSLAVTKALGSGPPPWNIIQAAAIGIKGAAQTALISQQKFAAGGPIMGQNAIIQANEEGQEGVVNAPGMNRLGVGGLNAINSGAPMTKTVTNQIYLSPTFNIEANVSERAVEMLEQNPESFADFFQRKIIGGGYLD